MASKQQPPHLGAKGRVITRNRAPSGGPGGPAAPDRPKKPRGWGPASLITAFLVTNPGPHTVREIVDGINDPRLDSERVHSAMSDLVTMGYVVRVERRRNHSTYAAVRS